MYSVSENKSKNIYIYTFQDEAKPKYIEGLPAKFKTFSEFLGKWKWFAGDNVRE